LGSIKNERYFDSLRSNASCEDTSDDIKDSFYEELGRVFGQFPRYNMNILLGDFNAKDIFKPTIRNESSHKISNDNGVTVVNFATINTINSRCINEVCVQAKFTF
jgi:hypothetical protein